MEYAEDPLLNHVLAINRALDACWPHSIARMDDAVQLPESRDLIRRFVLQELHEVATLLTLIVEVTADLRSIGHSFEITRKTETPQSIEHDSVKAVLLNRLPHRTSQVRVLLKALYEWLYHLREHLKSEPTLKAIVPRNLWSRLERYCTFRNSLVTHKKSMKFYGSSGLRFTSNFSKMEILMVPCPLPGPVVREVNALFGTALIHLEPSEAKEQNIFERMAILYRGLDRFPGDLRKRVKSLMAQYGTVSDTPDDIAEFLEEFVLAISPNLQGKQPSNPL